ncbi:hypothetical protein B0H14DRAFT_3424610 [Mycena olivaceomarginata]|nr:hypothetical protein B0H14DRAFT_3424610 [Mycena olivaceomarginata]
MRDKGKGKPPPLRSPSPPWRSPTLSLPPRPGDPPRCVPLVQRSTPGSTESMLPLAAHIPRLSLHSRLQRGPLDDVAEQKRARDEEGQQRRKKAQAAWEAALEARAPALSTMPPPPILVSSENTGKENAPLNGALAPSASTLDMSLVASELSPEASSTVTARSHSVQPVGSNSCVRLEDMDDGKLEEEQVWEWLNDDEPMGPAIF